MHFYFIWRRQNIISTVLQLPLKPHCVSGTTSRVMWVDNLMRRGSWRISCLLWKEERFFYTSHSLCYHLSCKWLTMPASFHGCGKKPTYQAMVIIWCSLLNILSPPWFHTSARIPSPPGALPSFKPAIALATSYVVGISSRLILVMRCGMLSTASWYMSPGTLSSFWKC